jgi:hypothetical protein
MAKGAGGQSVIALSDCEIIADNLSKTGRSWGCVTIVDRERRTIWIADAHRDNGKAVRWVC